MPARLPRNPDPDHLRSQARALQRAVDAGEADAVARLRVHHPRFAGDAPLPASLPLREAQQCLAREYGYTRWQDLIGFVELTASDGATRLRAAIDTNDVAAVRALVDAEPALLTAGLGYAGAGALTWAAECRGDATPPSPARLEIAQALIDAGSDVNERTGSPLFRASLNDGRIPMMELLVRNGANVNAVWQDYGPLLLGPCETLAPAALAWLLEHGADPNAREDDASYVPDALSMLLCTYSRDPQAAACFEALIAGGVDYEDGPVMDLHRGRLDLLTQRLDADPGLATSRLDFRRGLEYGGLYGGAPLAGFTLLHLCAEFGWVDAAKLLLARGADVNARCDGQPNEGRNTGWGDHTPIYHAVTANSNCAFELLPVLLDAGAWLDITATLHVPTGELDPPRTTVADVTPLGYAHAYPNQYLAGPGSAPKEGYGHGPHGNVVALLESRS